MDAFFASVELLRYPQLKGLPVVIGGGRRKVDELLLQGPDGTGLRERHFIPVEDFPLLKDYVGRGVITTATYPARQFGVGSAMGMMKAAKLCPQAIVLPVDFDEVRRFSRLFKSTIMELQRHGHGPAIVVFVLDDLRRPAPIAPAAGFLDGVGRIGCVGHGEKGLGCGKGRRA